MASIMAMQTPAGRLRLLPPFVGRNAGTWSWPLPSPSHCRRRQANQAMDVAAETKADDAARARSASHSSDSSSDDDFSLARMDPSLAQDISEVDTPCYSCHEPAKTRIMTIKVPFFREVIIFAFQCRRCGYKHNEARVGGAIMPKGCRYALTVDSEEVRPQRLASLRGTHPPPPFPLPDRT